MSQVDVNAINKNFHDQGARLRMLEFLVAQLYAISYIRDGVTQEQIDENHGRLRKEISQITFPDMGAVASDAWADEIERALDYQLGQIEAMYQARREG